MKKILFLPIAAALALAGCSDDPTAEEVVNGPEKGDGTRYLAVTISTPVAGPSLSATDHVGDDQYFDKGSEREQFAPTGLFILFDQNGSKCGNPQSVSLTPWTASDATAPQTERISSAVLIIGSQSAGVTKVEPNRVVCILNATQAIENAVDQCTNLTELKQIIDDLSFNGMPVDPSVDQDLTKGSIVMANSVYRNTNGGEEFAANISAHIATSPEAAKLNPVDIYVERVVAKVKASAMNKNNIHNTKINLKRAGVIEENVEIMPVVKGVSLGNVADKSYLFKNITGLTDTTFPDWTTWNDPTNKRCYWAISPSTTAAEGSAENPLGFRNKPWNGITDNPNTYSLYYIQENTSNTPTCVMVAAQLHTVKIDGTPDQPISICKIAGMYYTPEDGLTVLATYLQNADWRYLEADGKTVTTIQPEDLRWMTAEEAKTDASIKDLNLKGWETVARFAKSDEELAGRKIVKKRMNGAETVYDEKSIADMNAAMAQQQYRAWMWTDGYTYYFVNIEHFGFKNETITSGTGDDMKEETKKVFLEGIVRNHSYDLTLNSLKNLGVPVFDPTVDIIPEKPSPDAFYAAARINVLKWKMVSQTVNFE